MTQIDHSSIDSSQIMEKVSILYDGNEMQIENIHVKIHSKPNKHITAQLTGMVEAGVYDDYVKTANSAKGITIKHTRDGKQTLLYEGLIVLIRARAEGAAKENAVYWIEIEALSYTHLLDIEFKNRSFQDMTMLYDDLTKEVIADYDGADCLLHAPQGIAQQIFVLQYRDTDWGFLLREISKFEEALYADATMPKPCFHMGTPKGTSRGKLEEYDYTISKNLEKYRQRDQNIFDAYAEDTFQLCDPVCYQDNNLFICEVFSEIKDHKLYNTYKLATKNGLKMPRLANDNIQGLSIPGKVIAVEDNRLKLHLEIDQEQAVETAYWFDYAAFYATWYCMPELNDIVNLHFPTLFEQEAIGLNSFKQNSMGGYTRNNQAAIPPNASAAGKPGPIDFEKSARDPDVKILTTEAGRMIQLGPDNITIQFDEGTFLVLHDMDGIVLETNQDISLHAAGKIL